MSNVLRGIIGGQDKDKDFIFIFLLLLFFLGCIFFGGFCSKKIQAMLKKDTS